MAGNRPAEAGKTNQREITPEAEEVHLLGEQRDGDNEQQYVTMLALAEELAIASEPIWRRGWVGLYPSALLLRGRRKIAPVSPW